MAEPMRALTIRPPWSHAIAQGSKRVENRSWPAPAWAIGQDIAVHAGKSFDWDATFPAGHMAEWAPPEDCTLGAVVAVAELRGCHGPDDCPGTCSPWAVRGQYHWNLWDVRPLATPVPCRGMLGLWRLPEDAESTVRAQLRDMPATQGSECRS